MSILNIELTLALVLFTAVEGLFMQWPYNMWKDAHMWVRPASQKFEAVAVAFVMVVFFGMVQLGLIWQILGLPG